MADTKVTKLSYDNIETDDHSEDDYRHDELKTTSIPQKIEDEDKNACWLSVDLRLDSYSVKEELFTITGWINVHWKWTNAPPNLATKLMAMNYVDDDAKEQKYKIYENDSGQHIVEISDLRKSEITSLLPINANKVFYQPSLDSIDHIDPPYLHYNKQTKIFHTQYYVRASLLEDLELLTFPFDRQFLNLKLRFKFDYFRLLDYKHHDKEERFWKHNENSECHCITNDEKKVEDFLDDLKLGEIYFHKFLFHGINKMALVYLLDEQDLKEINVKLGDRKKIIKTIQTHQEERTHNLHTNQIAKQIAKQKNDEETKSKETNAKLIKQQTKMKICKKKQIENEIMWFFDNPVKIRLKETLMDEVKLHPAWIRFDLSKDNLNFALIRIRVVRNPVYTVSNVIMPFFVIVAASFSQFFIYREEIGDRLGVAIGILLTFAAFQGAISEELPESGEMLLIDWYISSAYVIQALLILEACVVSLDDDYQISSEWGVAIEYWVGIVLGVSWILFSFVYVSMWSENMRRLYGICFKCCCVRCCKKRKGWTDWKTRGSDEIERWKKINDEFKSYECDQETQCICKLKQDESLQSL
eukprot:339415_1